MLLRESVILSIMVVGLRGLIRNECSIIMARALKPPFASKSPTEARTLCQMSSHASEFLETRDFRGRYSRRLVQKTRYIVTQSSPRILTRCYCSDVKDSLPAGESVANGNLAFLLNAAESQLTVAEVLDQCVFILQDAEMRWKQSFEPEESAFNLVAAALDLPWESGYRDLMHIYQKIVSFSDPLACRILTVEEKRILHSLLQRRLHHEPIQYLTGKWDFLDRTFAVRAPLLCPRPETEELVLHVLEDIQKGRNEALNILDIGCGTGCIGISLAHRLKEMSCKITAIDLEPVAVDTSTENAGTILGEDWSEKYKVELCSAQDWKVEESRDRYHIVVSNPPYIPRADMETLEENVVKYESDDALCGGEDGLDVVRIIVGKLHEWCNAGAICWMEVDPTHPFIIHQWLEQSKGSLKVEFVEYRKDMFGMNRFVKLRVLP